MARANRAVLETDWPYIPRLVCDPRIAWTDLRPCFLALTRLDMNCTLCLVRVHLLRKSY